MTIHIGELIKAKLDEAGMDKTMFAHRIKKSYPTTLNILKKRAIKSDDLLAISKVLKYDFFRLYSAELQKTCPPAVKNVRKGSRFENKKTIMPSFRKNLYSDVFKNEILKQINAGNITAYEAIKKYELPKTTLYRWCRQNNMSIPAHQELS